jgi:hypothetical protein
MGNISENQTALENVFPQFMRKIQGDPNANEEIKYLPIAHSTFVSYIQYTPVWTRITQASPIYRIRVASFGYEVILSSIPVSTIDIFAPSNQMTFLRYNDSFTLHGKKEIYATCIPAIDTDGPDATYITPCYLALSTTFEADCSFAQKSLVNNYSKGNYNLYVRNLTGNPVLFRLGGGGGYVLTTANTANIYIAKYIYGPNGSLSMGTPSNFYINPSGTNGFPAMGLEPNEGLDIAITNISYPNTINALLWAA